MTPIPRRRRTLPRLVVLGCAATVVALAGCTSGGSDISRVRVYDGVEELAADSDLVVRATALTSQGGSVNGLAGEVTSFEITACPTVGGTVGTDRTSAAETIDHSCKPGAVVDVRTFSGDPVDGFDAGATYLLFLTDTGLPEDPDTYYYVTGAVVGAFKQSRDGAYERVVKDVPDNVPATLTDEDVA